MTTTKKSTETTTTAPVDPTITVESILIDTGNVDATVARYADATAGVKTKIRNAVTGAMMDAVRSADIAGAQKWSAVSDAFAASRPVAEPIDNEKVIADRIIALRYAAHRLLMGDVAPDGIDVATIDNAKVSAYIADWEKSGDPDAVTNDVATAGNRIATQKITRTTVRGSIESHIETAFAGMPVGTVLTVAQIRTKSGAASDGAIAARVWPMADKKTGAARASTLDFTALGVAATVNADGHRAIEKVAEPTA